MKSRITLVLPLVLLLVRYQLRDSDDWTPPTEKKAMDKAVAEILKEYKALSGNQDLVPTRRRRVLLLRLGDLPTKKCVKSLQADRQEGARHPRQDQRDVLPRPRIGDVKAVDAMYKYCLKEYPFGLSRLTSGVRSPRPPTTRSRRGSSRSR